LSPQEEHFSLHLISWKIVAFAIKCVTKYVRYFRLSALKTVELTITNAKYSVV